MHLLFVVQVGKFGGIEFGTVRNFLLEKSRILNQENDERSYHVFYQLLKGASAEQRKMFCLRGLKGYKCINPNCLDAPGIVRRSSFSLFIFVWSLAFGSDLRCA